MITDDYVSFETAKLLKEKEFNESCRCYYTDKGKFVDMAWNLYEKHNTNSELNEFSFCSAPTLQMAMKWLREMHKIYIDISPTYSEAEKTIHFIWQIFDSNYDGIGDCEIFYGKYETACEEAIKYCLEDLI